MGFTEAVKTCFSKYSDFSGRASRSEFWYFTLFVAIYTTVLGFLLGIVIIIQYPEMSEQDIDYFFNILILFLILPILLPSFTVTARRFHDFGHSGWIQIGFYLLMGIFGPMDTTQGFVLYTIVFVSFYVYASQKPVGENKYGTPI